MHGGTSTSFAQLCGGSAQGVPEKFCAIPVTNVGLWSDVRAGTGHHKARVSVCDTNGVIGVRWRSIVSCGNFRTGYERAGSLIVYSEWQWAAVVLQGCQVGWVW